jgi:hypothetical protein
MKGAVNLYFGLWIYVFSNAWFAFNEIRRISLNFNGNYLQIN